VTELTKRDCEMPHAPDKLSERDACTVSELPMSAVIAAVSAMHEYTDEYGRISADVLVTAFRDGFRAAINALHWGDEPTSQPMTRRSGAVYCLECGADATQEFLVGKPCPKCGATRYEAWEKWRDDDDAVAQSKKAPADPP
jgi:hypothetical protein